MAGRVARGAVAAGALAVGGALLALAWLGWPPRPERLPMPIVSPGVRRVAPETLAGWRVEGRTLTLYDVRTVPEFQVSHLPGAVRVDPEARSLPSPRDTGGAVVLYCAVGIRSTRLAARLGSRGLDVVDLDGGIFGWANRGLPLVDAEGRPTRRVHPYDAFWGVFLRGRE